MTTTDEFDLVPTHLAIQAMRDSGYKNTAYAVAELIDNSIQAGATNVELLCAEEQDLVQERVRRRIKHIAVLDNGSGMDEQVLRMALQFGNGTRLNDRSGMGRFGMGLPSASISQCRNVEVWTWQEGPDRALYTFIDLDKIASEGSRSVPPPAVKRLPETWKLSAEGLGQTGTLVVWSSLDRCMWRTAKTVIDRSEYVIGRMYRNFIDVGQTSIRLASFVVDDAASTNIDRFVDPNDPMYLMTGTSTPSPYDDEPMFQRDGDHWEMEHLIRFRAKDYPVKIRFSLARESVRNEPNAGATKHGKHARGNIGLSLVRAGRELELDQSLVNGYDPRERWWGVEIDFPPALDEVFGVTNNKQSARHFGQVASDIENILTDDARSVAEIKESMEENDEPTAPLVDIVHLVDRRLKLIRKGIQVQTRGQRSARKRHDDSPEARGTKVTKELQDRGHHGQSDDDEQSLSAAEREGALRQELIESGLSAEQAHEISAQTISTGIKYTFAAAHLEGRMFFTVKPVAGEIVVKLNTEHPAYWNLVEVLEEEAPDDTAPEELLGRLARANMGLKLLLMAWARFEDEANEKQRMDLQDIRTDWGRYAAHFLEG